jgi:hypothetical protein
MKKDIFLLMVWCTIIFTPLTPNVSGSVNVIQNEALIGPSAYGKTANSVTNTIDFYPFPFMNKAYHYFRPLVICLLNGECLQTSI